MVQSTDDCDLCEICLTPVEDRERSAFAGRHGATIHINCLQVQMTTR